MAKTSKARQAIIEAASRDRQIRTKSGGRICNIR